MNKKLILAVTGISAVSILGSFSIRTLITKRSDRLVEITELHNKKELLDTARDYVERGEYVKAKRSFEAFCDEFPYADNVPEIRDQIEELNMKILFSSLDSAWSTSYTVKPGDTLSKIASFYGTTIELIKKANKLGSDTIYPGQALKINTEKFRILVDKSENILFLESAESGDIIKAYTVSTGEKLSTPTGTFSIEEKMESPIWYKVGAVIKPSNSEYELGSRWMGLSVEGYGIHGTRDPSAIGEHITKGCVRMRNEDVEELYAIVPSGTEVRIIE